MYVVPRDPLVLAIGIGLQRGSNLPRDDAWWRRLAIYNSAPDSLRLQWDPTCYTMPTFQGMMRCRVDARSAGRPSSGKPDA